MLIFSGGRLHNLETLHFLYNIAGKKKYEKYQSDEIKMKTKRIIT